MGLDFIRKTAPSFQRALDKRAVALRTPTLFGRDIPLMSRSARANICHAATVMPGETVLLRSVENKIVAQRDNLVIAEFTSPTVEMRTHLECGAGVGLGKVKSVHPLSETVEIEICE